MGAGKLTRKPNDPDDQRRVDELEEALRPITRKHTSTPSVKQLRNYELVLIDDGTTRQLGIRIDGSVFGVTITEL